MYRLILILILFASPAMAQQAPVITDTVLSNGNIQRTTTITQIFTPSVYQNQITAIQNQQAQAQALSTQISTMQDTLSLATPAAAKSLNTSASTP